jgi:hypothetical protein
MASVPRDDDAVTIVLRVSGVAAKTAADHGEGTAEGLEMSTTLKQRILTTTRSGLARQFPKLAHRWLRKVDADGRLVLSLPSALYADAFAEALGETVAYGIKPATQFTAYTLAATLRQPLPVWQAETFMVSSVCRRPARRPHRRRRRPSHRRPRHRRRHLHLSR